METSLNDMSETNGLKEENMSSLKGLLNQVFHLEDKDLRTYSPLTLAYIGDGVYELVIRTILVKPIHPKEEIQIVLKRRLEAIVLLCYRLHRKIVKPKYPSAAKKEDSSIL